MKEEETVANDIEWNNLEDEDALTSIGSSLQAAGPFPFHGGDGISREPVEAGHTIGLPQDPTGAGGSVVALEVQAKVGSSTIVPE